MAAKKETKDVVAPPMVVRASAVDGEVVLSYGHITPEDDPDPEKGHKWTEKGEWKLTPGDAVVLGADLPVVAQEANAQTIASNRAKTEAAEEVVADADDGD